MIANQITLIRFIQLLSFALISRDVGLVLLLNGLGELLGRLGGRVALVPEPVLEAVHVQHEVRLVVYLEVPVLHPLQPAAHLPRRHARRGAALELPKHVKSTVHGFCSEIFVNLNYIEFIEFKF